MGHHQTLLTKLEAHKCLDFVCCRIEDYLHWNEKVQTCLIMTMLCTQGTLVLLFKHQCLTSLKSLILTATLKFSQQSGGYSNRKGGLNLEWDAQKPYTDVMVMCPQPLGIFMGEWMPNDFGGLNKNQQQNLTKRTRQLVVTVPISMGDSYVPFWLPQKRG